MSTTKRTSRAVDARGFLDGLLGGPIRFGGVLRAIRLGEEQSQAVFAERLGVTKQHLSDVENDRRGVGIERAAEWAEQLGQSPALFVELALQAQVRAAGLPFVVKVQADSETPRRRPPRRAA